MTNNLHTLLTKKGKTRYWLAKQLGLHTQFVYQICANQRPIPEKHKLKIKELLGLDSTDELY